VATNVVQKCAVKKLYSDTLQVQENMNSILKGFLKIRDLLLTETNLLHLNEKK
jgi:hypothetical protein